MNCPDIRWQQRFDNFTRALQTLTEAIELAHQRPLVGWKSRG